MALFKLFPGFGFPTRGHALVNDKEKRPRNGLVVQAGFSMRGRVALQGGREALQNLEQGVAAQIQKRHPQVLFVAELGERKRSILEFREQLFILDHRHLASSVLNLLNSCLMPGRAPRRRRWPSRRSADRPQTIVPAAREKEPRRKIRRAKSSLRPAESMEVEIEAPRPLRRFRESAAPRRASHDGRPRECRDTRSTP